MNEVNMKQITFSKLLLTVFNLFNPSITGIETRYDTIRPLYKTRMGNRALLFQFL